MLYIETKFTHARSVYGADGSASDLVKLVNLPY